MENGSTCMLKIWHRHINHSHGDREPCPYEH